MAAVKEEGGMTVLKVSSRRLVLKRLHIPPNYIDHDGEKSSGDMKEHCDTYASVEAGLFKLNVGSG